MSTGRVGEVFLCAACLACLLLVGAASCTRSGEAREVYLEGRELYASRSLEQALERFQRATRLDRRLRQGYVMAAKCLYYLEREGEAAALLEDTLRRFPRYTDARFWMARVLYELNSLEEAEEHALAVVEQDAAHLDARLLLGDIYREQGAYEKALLNYRVVTASLDVVALSCLNMARIYLSAGRYRQALEELGFLTANAGRLNPLLLDQARGLLTGIQGTEVPHEDPER